LPLAAYGAEVDTVEREPGLRQVRVCVDERRCHERTVEIDDLRHRGGIWHLISCAADPRDRALDQQQGREVVATARPPGVHVPAAEQQWPGGMLRAWGD